MDNMVDIEAGSSESNVENADISVDIAAEIKVVIVLKSGRGSIGVQAPDCDPLFITFEGGLEAALERLPGMVEEARSRWTESPKNPKTARSVPPAPPPSAPRRGTPQRSTSSEGSMQSMF